MTAEPLRQAVTELALLAGEESIDWADEHERWRLYQRILQVTDTRAMALLGHAVKHECDGALALSVVLKIMEQVPAGQRDRWVQRLSQSEDRDYARARSLDLSALDSLTEPAEDTKDDYAEATWSQWLQLRLAALSGRRGLLEFLAASGSTKRIRRVAKERLER